jgi:hypothetical protein
MMSNPTGAWTTINSILSPELKDARELASGLSAPLGWVASQWPGSDSAQLATLRTKLTAQSFTQSIADLRARGATVGQVTEIEGEKLQNALLTLQATTSDEAFERELQNFRKSLIAFIRSAREVANPGQAQSVYDIPTTASGIDLRTFTQRENDREGMLNVSDEQSARVREMNAKYNLGLPES